MISYYIRLLRHVWFSLNAGYSLLHGLLPSTGGEHVVYLNEAPRIYSSCRIEAEELLCFPNEPAAVTRAELQLPACL
jgi:hypothetical protein